MKGLEYLKYEEYGFLCSCVLVVTKRNGKLGYEHEAWGFDRELDKKPVDRWKEYKGKDKDFLKSLEAIPLENLRGYTIGESEEDGSWFLEYKSDDGESLNMCGGRVPPKEIEKLKDLLGCMVLLDTPLLSGYKVE